MNNSFLLLAPVPGLVLAPVLELVLTMAEVLIPALHQCRLWHSIQDIMYATVSHHKICPEGHTEVIIGVSRAK